VCAHTRKKDLPHSKDKRYFHRWPVANRVLYRLSETALFHEGLTSDLSCAGACISVEVPPPTNQKIQLKIFFDDAVNVDLEGNVIWKKSIQGRNQIGVFFSMISNKAQETILKYAYHQQ